MKTVICGLWHVHAPMYFETAKKYGEVIGAWDHDARRLAGFCEKNGVRAFGSFDELLKSGADNAVVCTSSDTHADVIVSLAEAGIGIFTEKVLALTTAECERVEAAVEKSGVRFAISFPHKFDAGIMTLKAIADSGELGKINYFRFRNVHDGSSSNWLPRHFYDLKECGGGAMIDLGAHGMYLADWFLGMPDSASSVFTNACTNSGALEKNRDKVEDNAVTVLRWADGAIALNETGFVSFGCPMTLEIGGDKGWARYDRKTIVKRSLATEKRLVEVTPLEVMPTPADQFFSGGIPAGCGLKEAKNLTRLMEMAYNR